MSTIATRVTEEQFKQHILPFLRTAKRGYVSKIPLYKLFNYRLYRLYTGCQWQEVPIAPDAHNPKRQEISHDALYYHFRKWSGDGSLERVWQHSIEVLKDDLDLSVLNLDGSHVVAKKGAEGVAYQGRKRAKTCNILPITDHQGYIIATTGIVAGNHNDAFDLKPHLQSAFKALKQLGLTISGAYFNADAAFDTREACKVCFNHRVIPNITENKRNPKAKKPGCKRFFDPSIYKDRFICERTFAWIDKFRALLVRFERKKIYCMGNHFLAFSLINLRFILS